jgi:hypothetical protein
MSLETPWGQAHYVARQLARSIEAGRAGRAVDELSAQ